MKKKILFIGATHGDEPIGVRTLESLEKRRTDFDWIVGNVPAFERGTRCFEGDLNRSAPGNIEATTYTSRRAAEILVQSKRYDVTIDLHGAIQNTGIFLIVTNPKKENVALAKTLDVRRVVVWPSFSPELSGPMSEFFPCGFEIECGPKNDPNVQAELECVLANFLDGVSLSEPQEWFEVYGALRESTDITLKEFEEAIVNGETFFPLLVGTYTEMNGVVCYKMRCTSK